MIEESRRIIVLFCDAIFYGVMFPLKEISALDLMLGNNLDSFEFKSKTSHPHHFNGGLLSTFTHHLDLIGDCTCDFQTINCDLIVEHPVINERGEKFCILFPLVLR